MEQSELFSKFARSCWATLRRAPSLDETASYRDVTLTTAVSRHDHHNIEIKSSCEMSDGPFAGELDVFLFVPRSFDLPSWEKHDLEKDLRIRLRLAIPVGREQGLSALIQARDALKNAVLRSVHQNKEEGHSLESEDGLLEPARDVSAVVSETLKQWAQQQTRAFLLAHTPLATADSCLSELERLHDAIKRTAATLVDLRVLLAPMSHRSPLLRALEEYLSHLYVQYLGSLHTEFDRIPEPPAAADPDAYWLTRKRLERELDRASEAEGAYRRRAGWSVNHTENEVERERRLVRMSHLKKFFQSRSFVDISRRPSARRFSESTALAGAALAGLTASFFQQLNRPDLVDVAFQGFFVICFGATAYVLRDRLKDWAKTAFHRQARRFLPDYEQVLMAQNRRIGCVKEWLHIRDRAGLPEQILALRSGATGADLELRLPEDVLHYRKTQEIAGDALGETANRAPLRALHENIRINFERYLKHMDDPFKELVDLDDCGRLHSSRSRRVYHFHLAIRATRRPLDSGIAPRRRSSAAAGLETLTFHRVVLDKTGIVRIEDVRSKSETGHQSGSEM